VPSDDQVARRSNVSRTPMRDALGEFEREGGKVVPRVEWMRDEQIALSVHRPLHNGPYTMRGRSAV